MQSQEESIQYNARDRTEQQEGEKGGHLPHRRLHHN